MWTTYDSWTNIFQTILPNGKVYVSNQPITFESLKHLTNHLGIEYTYSDYIKMNQKSIITIILIQQESYI